MKTTYFIPVFLLLLFVALQPAVAQKIPSDYRWGRMVFQKIINSHDDGFISLTASSGKFQEHAVVKINSERELVYRFEANPEKMFKHFVKDGETWSNRALFELSNGNVVVYFSAAKEAYCPSVLYYYVLSPKGELLQTANVLFDKYLKSIENPKLDKIVMVDDNEFLISLSYGPSCKDIFKNSARNKTVMFNLSTGFVKPINDLDGHEVINCVAEDGYVYLLTIPIRFYRDDNGNKEYRENRFYHLWKLNVVYSRQTVKVLDDLLDGAIIPRIELDKNNIRLVYCRQLYNEMEFGYKLFDKESLLQRRVKVYKSKLFDEDPYAVSENYFLSGSTIISDSSGDNMILFSMAPWKSGDTYSKNIYAAVVMDGVLRNDTKVIAADQRYTLAVSQINSKGKYFLCANGYEPLSFLGDFNEDVLPSFYQNETALQQFKQKLLKEKIVKPGSPVVVNDIAEDDLYYYNKTNLLGKTFKAGKYLVRYGNGSYTGYLMDSNNREMFFYNIKLAYPAR